MSPKMLPLPNPDVDKRYNLTLSFKNGTKEYVWSNVRLERDGFHLIVKVDGEKDKRFHQYALTSIRMEECLPLVEDSLTQPELPESQDILKTIENLNLSKDHLAV